MDYAWAVSLQKDITKVKIIEDSNLIQPILKPDDFGFTIILPTPKAATEDGELDFLGFKFTDDTAGKIKIGRLFRASVLHLSAHTLVPISKDKISPKESDSIIDSFIKSLLADIYVNVYIREKFPASLLDIAFANALSLHKIKAPNRIYAQATRIMTAILRNCWCKNCVSTLDPKEETIVNKTLLSLRNLETLFSEAIHNDQVCLEQAFDDSFKQLSNYLESVGPFLEAPSFRHTESLGPCSIYADHELSDISFEEVFKSSLLTMGNPIAVNDDLDKLWKPENDLEALQAFNSDRYQKQRQQKILSKIEPYLASTQFRSVSFPEEDYTQYLRARSLVQGANRRLLEILRSAFNYLDEDPRQEMGQLDLTAVIQSLASNKPATDVFVLDEYLKPSFAWSILFDVSKSMKVRGEYSRALAIAVAEAAKELMLDATSWTFFAFSDRLYLLKDSTESYSKRVRARIGGLDFDGLTFIPDAIHVAGKMLAKRYEEQRCLIVISDGWPNGYANMPSILKKTVDSLLNKGVIVLGIGVETDRMGKFFKLHSAIYSQKDLVNKFGHLYLDASAKALET
jgi:Mg-chelatase subunit ChlD